jgi:hypothetical protein
MYAPCAIACVWGVCGLAWDAALRDLYAVGRGRSNPWPYQHASAVLHSFLEYYMCTSESTACLPNRCSCAASRSSSASIAPHAIGPLGAACTMHWTDPSGLGADAARALLQLLVRLAGVFQVDGLQREHRSLEHCFDDENGSCMRPLPSPAFAKCVLHACLCASRISRVFVCHRPRRMEPAALHTSFRASLISSLLCEIVTAQSFPPGCARSTAAVGLFESACGSARRRSTLRRRSTRTSEPGTLRVFQTCTRYGPLLRAPNAAPAASGLGLMRRGAL